MGTNLLKETMKIVNIKKEIKRKSEIKKYIQILFGFITFISIMFGVYQKPELIFEENTQQNIIDIVENIDNQINDLNIEENIN